jgi:DNA-binding NarL/FixJ family response regulator
MTLRPVRDPLACLEELPAITRSLCQTTSVTEFLARAADATRATFGFRRGVALTLADGYLGAADSDPLEDLDSDALRRRALAEPVRLARGSVEGELVHEVEVGSRPRSIAGSPLADALGLEEYVMAGIAPESRVLAVLVLDRPDPEPSRLEVVAIRAFAASVAVGMAQVVLRARVLELSRELRYLSASTQAMADEVLDAPVSMPSGGRHFPTFARMDLGSAVAPDGLAALLNDRERQIARLLVEGRSNREIAVQLMLSPATVKDYVARILRKLHVSNRVEAVSRLVGVIS